jgi:hypothetical protein
MAAMARRREPRTLLELCVARAGGTWRSIPKGMRVCQFVLEWLVQSLIEERAITMPEYRRFWDEPERSAFRHLAEFRELFGEGKNNYSDPQPLVDIIAPQVPRAQLEAFGKLRELKEAKDRKARMRDLDVQGLLSSPIEV